MGLTFPCPRTTATFSPKSNRNVGKVGAGKTALKGKELDPKKFDENEKHQFDASDLKNRSEHLRLGAVRVLSPTDSEHCHWIGSYRYPLASFGRTNPQTRKHWTRGAVSW